MSGPLAPPTVEFGQGPAVVLLHAFPLDGRIWLDPARALSSHWRVLVPDLRGFGAAASQLESLSEISIELLADDVAALLDERGIERAIVGGISRGGYAALAFARKYPQRLNALMLFDTRANPADQKETDTYTKLVERLAVEGVEAAVDAMRTRLFAPATSAEQPQLVEWIETIIRSQDPAAVAAAARGMVARPDARPWLAEIHAPTLALAGVHDAAFENTRFIAEAIPGTQFVAVPAAGHLSILENPEFVLAAMRDFLDAVRPSLTE